MAIDVHAHFVPSTVIETLVDHGADFGIDLVETEPGCHCCRFSSGIQIRPFFDALTHVEIRLDEMARIGLQHQILSMWTDIFGYEMPADKGLAWHRVMNECLANLCVIHSEQFSWMASGPLQDPAAAARELERSMADGAVGAIVGTHVDHENLGECELDEYWAACVELNSPVFLHPAQPIASKRAKKFALNQVVAYTNDTSLTVGSLISNGVLDRFPKLQLVLSHGGGSVPWLIGRFDRMHNAAPHKLTGTVAKKPPSFYLGQMYYDTILHHGPALRYLRDLVGVDQLVLGTDFPFPPGDPNPIKTLKDAEFAVADIERISEINPRRLYDV